MGRGGRGGGGGGAGCRGGRGDGGRQGHALRPRHGTGRPAAGKRPAAGLRFFGQDLWAKAETVPSVPGGVHRALPSGRASGHGCATGRFDPALSQKSRCSADEIRRGAAARGFCACPRVRVPWVSCCKIAACPDPRRPAGVRPRVRSAPRDGAGASGHDAAQPRRSHRSRAAPCRAARPGAPGRLALEGALLVVDFDGTLVEIAERPDAVTVPGEVRGLLSDLHARTDGATGVVSGRHRRCGRCWRAGSAATRSGRVERPEPVT
ncbi:MAG: hypothetical protein MUE82_13265 [Chloroflexi bacterium]|nr:hypothetical protein [Chloroflexota bacterium]